jgi:hypothetical protein
LILTLAVAALLLGGVGVVRAQRGGAVEGASVAAGQPSEAARARTQTAIKSLGVLLEDRTTLVTQKAALQKRYEGQLADVDALKQKRASWYRDRQLREAMAKSLETADKLAAIASKLRAIDARVKRERTELVAAIDAELVAAGGAIDAKRKTTLAKLRHDHAAALRPTGKKIVLPDDRIDPLADPEELDQQVAALEQSERQLQKEVASLERQATRFEKMDDLREKHDRADELGGFDDDQPRRSTGRSGARNESVGLTGGAAGEGDSAPAPGDDFDSGVPEGMFENDPTVVLSDVVDAETIGALRQAEISDDPGVKAKAATRAAKKVEERLRKLRTQRAAIEKRARKLRGE